MKKEEEEEEEEGGGGGGQEEEEKVTEIEEKIIKYSLNRLSRLTIALQLCL